MLGKPSDCLIGRGVHYRYVTKRCVYSVGETSWRSHRAWCAVCLSATLYCRFLFLRGPLQEWAEWEFSNWIRQLIFVMRPSSLMSTQLLIVFFLPVTHGDDLQQGNAAENQFPDMLAMCHPTQLPDMRHLTQLWYMWFRSTFYAVSQLFSVDSPDESWRPKFD